MTYGSVKYYDQFMQFDEMNNMKKLVSEKLPNTNTLVPSG